MPPLERTRHRVTTLQLDALCRRCTVGVVGLCAHFAHPQHPPLKGEGRPFPPSGLPSSNSASLAHGSFFFNVCFLLFLNQSVHPVTSSSCVGGASWLTVGSGGGPTRLANTSAIDIGTNSSTRSLSESATLSSSKSTNLPLVAQPVQSVHNCAARGSVMSCSGTI
eukprot:3831599-Prymnesium_polylepis.3